MLVIWSERHKYPPFSVVITSASAIDSSNKCLEGLYVWLHLMAGWWLGMSFKEGTMLSGWGWKQTTDFHPVTRSGPQNKSIYSKAINFKFVVVDGFANAHISTCNSTCNSIFDLHISASLKSMVWLTGQHDESVTDWSEFNKLIMSLRQQFIQNEHTLSLLNGHFPDPI